MALFFGVVVNIPCGLPSKIYVENTGFSINMGICACVIVTLQEVNCQVSGPFYYICYDIVKVFTAKSQVG